MANNGVAPSQLRRLDKDDKFLGFYEPARYAQTDDMPELVARGVLPFQYLELGDRFRGCTEAAHIHDVLLAEGVYPRPTEWKVIYDRRRKAARERVKKRQARYKVASGQS